MDMKNIKFKKLALKLHYTGIMIILKRFKNIKVFFRNFYLQHDC